MSSARGPNPSPPGAEAAEPYDFTDFKDFYNALDVPPDADVDSIKKSYRKLILDWHPDKRPDSPNQTGKKMFQLINDAWNCLQDDAKREEYTEMWREYHKQKLMPFERAELARKEGNELYKKGQTAARENNIPQALTMYQAAIERYSEGIANSESDHRLYSNRALCYAVLRDWPRAKRDAQKVVEIRPNFMKGWFTLVRSYIMENNLEDASRCLDRGLRSCDQHPDLAKLSEEIAARRSEQAPPASSGNATMTLGNSNVLGSSQRASSRSPRETSTGAVYNLDGSLRTGGTGLGASTSQSNLQGGASSTSLGGGAAGSSTSPGGAAGGLNTSSKSGAGGAVSGASPPLGSSRPLSYRDVTPSRTPPTPLMQHRMGLGSSRGMTAPSWATQQDLDGTGNFGGTSNFGGGFGDTANFGRSIGYARTPPKGNSPRFPPGGAPTGSTPPRYVTPPRMGTSGGLGASNGSARGSGIDYGTANPLNQSHTQFAATHGVGGPQYAYPRSASRTPPKPREVIVVEQAGPVRAPSLQSQANLNRDRNSSPRIANTSPRAPGG
ncbi:unnamed protein product [Amoebophrya sp. A25]|nr:unnamed protein product [Amoebophrya sp. A25]|eukprot:GSA25T00010892001.1